MEVRASQRQQRTPPTDSFNNSNESLEQRLSSSSEHSTTTSSTTASIHKPLKMAFQLNISLGLDEVLARLQTYRTEELVCVVHDRTPTAPETQINDEGLLTIFEALGNLPNLRSLRVDFVGRPLRIPARALSVVLRRVSQLNLLILEEVRLTGDEQEFEDLARAFQAHRSLKEVYLHGCAPGSNISLDPVLTALAHCPTVQEVLLRETRISPHTEAPNNNNNNNRNDINNLQNQQLQQVAANLQIIQNNLQQLHPLAPPAHLIMHPPNPLNPPPHAILLNAHAAAVAPPPLFDDVRRLHAPAHNQRGRANGDGNGNGSDTTLENTWAGTSLSELCRSPSLRILTLRDMTEINDGHIELMSDALCHNSTLRELTICSGNLGIASGRAMGSVLQANRILEKLEIQLNCGEDAIPITEVLQRNSTLKRLDLFFNGPINPRIREAFTEMLRCNYVLLDLNGSVWRGQSNLELDFLLRLNRAGRGDLLTEHATRKQWVETLISQQDDLSIVFSLLSMNPLICVPDQGSYGQPRRRSHSGHHIHLRKRRKGETCN